jgi:hypothetical protein
MANTPGRLNKKLSNQKTFSRKDMRITVAEKFIPEALILRTA